MVGRYKKVHHEIKREISIELPNGASILLATVVIKCPICQSTYVSTNGTRKRKMGRSEAFQCKNPHCDFLQHHKYGKQFLLSTSHQVKEQIWTLLNQLYKDIIQEGAKAKTIARKYHISDALVSHLRRDLEDTIDSHRGLDRLVEVPQEDRAIAIDETFLKIQGKPIYIIIATGYTTKKILGIKVSETRNEQDMREVFDEADRNTKEPIIMATADAWGATQTMAKNLNRDFTLIIHKHKSPYDRAVIRHFKYTSTERIITDIGVHVDVFKYRKTRKYKYLQKSELLQAPAATPRGRPKGRKSGQKKAKSKTKNQRGRKGLDAVFSKGKQGIVRVNPYRKTLRFGKKRVDAVADGLSQAFSLFAGKTIQNNLSETTNSMFQSHIRLRGPKTIEKAERNVRTKVIVRNNPKILDSIRVDHNLRLNFLFSNVNVDCISRMNEKGWDIYGLQKMG